MSIMSFSLLDDDDGESSDDSRLSYWSSDDEESDTEVEAEHEHEHEHELAAAAAAKKEAEAKKEDERKRREEQRQKALAAAGLQIRREPPGVPKARRRRPAPAVPVKKSGSHEKPPEYEGEQPAPPEKPIEVQDAYARYEAFLAETKQRAPFKAPQVARPSTVIEGPPRPTSTPAAGGRFAGLLSKMGVQPTTEADARPTPRISGPIVGAPIGASVDDQAVQESSFGKTWSSLVDPSTLSTMSEQERKRQEAIFEFITTEGSYVRDLQLVVGVFYAALMEVLDEQTLKVIFANVEDILMLNTFFFSALEDRQKECRLYIDTIGDILAEHCQNLEVYAPYCVNQDQAAKLLVQLRRENAELERTLLNIRENNAAVRGLELSSFLLEPSE